MIRTLKDLRNYIHNSKVKGLVYSATAWQAEPTIWQIQEWKSRKAQETGQIPKLLASLTAGEYREVRGLFVVSE